MNIKTTFCIWKDVTIEEQQPDEWGREGRGTPFVYYNTKHKFHKKKWVAINDIQQWLYRMEAMGHDEGIIKALREELEVEK